MSGEWTFSRKMTKTERARGLGRKNKRGDSKGESNDSPEIPDRNVLLMTKLLFISSEYIQHFLGVYSQENSAMLTKSWTVVVFH